jgi:hypothetical protein
MRILFCLIFLVLFSGCEKRPILYHPDPKWDTADVIYNNQIGKPVFLQLKKENNLKVIESGWGLRGRKNIRCMHCGFAYHNEITVEEARKLLLETGNLYLKTINENEKIRPFLENYPFGPENIEIRIFINPEKTMQKSDKLRVITIVDGKLSYMIRDQYLTTIYEETYEEALDKLKTVDVSM